MTLHLDIHVLQSVPPANLNRDDTGSPKTARYGGVQRARVSSQAWKRATRRDFSTYLDSTSVGVRTLRAVELLAERIMALNPTLDETTARKLATAALKAVGISTKPRRKKSEDVEEAEQTSYLIFFSNLQLDRVAELAAASADGSLDKKAVKEALNSHHSFDVALFGRMVADAADINVDAACQVAHALSTHAVSIEADYYTAVDDKNPAEETGAGMIGTVEFNSATLYRYATINVDALRANLGDEQATARATEAFIRSFCHSMPTGKQNTFANNTLPDTVVVMARQGRPVSLVGAFEDPITNTGEGFMKQSVAALARQAEAVETFVPAPVHSWVAALPQHRDALAGLGEVLPMDGLVSAVGEHVLGDLSDES